MRRNQPLALVLSLAIVMLVLPHGAAQAESFEPAKDLKHDVEILQIMIRSDLSKYPLPTIKVVPEAEFDAYIKKLADESGVPQEKRFGGFQPCDTDPDLILISSVYPETAAQGSNPIDPYKYFRIIRIHELYHWASCKIAGADRFWAGLGAWSHEEGQARAIEIQFANEQLGEVAALPEDYQYPPMPRQTPEGFLPDDGKKTEYRGLRSQMWKLAGDVPGLVQWKTVSGSIIFVGVAQATALVKKQNYYPNFDVPGQHIPRVPDPTDMYYFNTVMHRGHYVGFEVFEVEGDSVMFGIRQGLWVKKYSWWDEGYVPVVKDGKGFAPDDPVYTGKWIQTYSGSEEKK